MYIVHTFCGVHRFRLACLEERKICGDRGDFWPQDTRNKKSDRKKRDRKGRRKGSPWMRVVFAPSLYIFRSFVDYCSKHEHTHISTRTIKARKSEISDEATQKDRLMIAEGMNSSTSSYSRENSRTYSHWTLANTSNKSQTYFCRLSEFQTLSMSQKLFFPPFLHSLLQSSGEDSAGVLPSDKLPRKTWKKWLKKVKIE